MNIRAVGLLLFALLPFTAAAQLYTAKTIVFSHLGTFTQQQLETAAGLHAGSTLTAAQLGEAATRLVNTGYFDSVDATLEGPVSAVTVLIDDKPTPLAAMLHVGFENFVWLSHDQLEAAIKAVVPLFNDYLPENSPNQDHIKSALAAALAATSIKAEVEYDTYEPTLLHPQREIAFRVSSPSVRVANVRLAGVSPALVPLVQTSINATVLTPYTEGPADLTTADRILAPLLDAGYVKATLTSTTLSPASASGGSVPVIVSSTLNAGEIYKLSAITFAGTPILSAADFNSSVKLHPGDVASRKLLLLTLEPIDTAYRRLGYMDVVIDPHPALDETTHLVSYAPVVTPGEPYRVHEVTTSNLDPAAKADFNRIFLLKPGTIYNPDYIRTFLKNNSAIRSFDHYSASFKAYADPGTHTVDVVITFSRGIANN